MQRGKKKKSIQKNQKNKCTNKKHTKNEYTSKHTHYIDPAARRGGRIYPVCGQPGWVCGPRRIPSNSAPLAPTHCYSGKSTRNTRERLTSPFSLWLLFYHIPELKKQGCIHLGRFPATRWSQIRHTSSRKQLPGVSRLSA